MRTLRSALFLITFIFLTIGSAFAGVGKMNPSLKLLRHVHSNSTLKARARGIMKSALETDNVVVTVQFDRVLSKADVASYKSDGISFYHIDGNIARTGTIYPARIPWETLDAFSQRIEVLRLEGNWNPAVYPLLDVSAAETEAAHAWTYNDDMGSPLTGEGMRIADFDTGIDVFHPSFFYADGDTLDWIDANESGVFEPGIDIVDLNENGTTDANELLDFEDGWIYDPAHVWSGSIPGNQDGVYQAWWDWLYNDANGNGSRDFGPGAGYTENDPTYGEQFFITIDTDADGVLDVGEKLIALGTSKIYATMNADSIERVRGTDLILSDDDTYGHGTPVSGILAGGTRSHHRFTGVAPDAEILMGYYFSGVPLSYLIPWARSRGADVMLYEFGGFIYRALDGSSLDEQLISTESETIIQITPSGNLGRGNKHAIAPVSPNDSTTLLIDIPTYGGQDITRFYGTTLWRTGTGDLTFRLKSPLGGEVTLEGGVSGVDAYYVWFDVLTSPRGTCEFDLYVSNLTNPHCLGTWELKIVNNTGSEIEVTSNISDHLSSWAGGAEFLNYATDERNVTFPATSDSAFVNGSYSTRGFEGYDGVGGGSVPAGEISAFSGRGVRVDGKHLLDICSPGNYDVYSVRSHTDGSGYPLGGYRQFSGTSAAGPHVAAAAAIVQQRWPGEDMNQVAAHLTSSAATDAYTGAVYNDTWGFGKLRLLGAIGVALGVQEIMDGRRAPGLFLDQNFPNPFNPSTWIPFYVPETGRASVKIFNVHGRLVRTLHDDTIGEGAHSIRWNGVDDGGQPVATGIYFCVLRQGNVQQSRKLLLLK